MSDPMQWLKDAIYEQFGSELAAGKYYEYPALRQMWLETLFEKAEAAQLSSNRSARIN